MEPRVLQVVLSLIPGGTESLVVELCRRLPRESVAGVCCLDLPGAWAERVEALGLRVVALGRKPGFHPSLGRRLGQVAADLGAQVIHAHQYSPFVYSRIATLLDRRLGLVFTEHGRQSDAPPSIKRRLVNPLLASGVREVAAVSSELRGHMLREGFSIATKVVYNGIDVGSPAAAEERGRARQAMGLADEAFAVGTVARLDPVKDLHTLIRATSEVVGRLPHIALRVIGDGPERASLEEAGRSLCSGVDSAFLGHRPDARMLLPGLDAYVNCSTSEGVSLSILEAMAASLPVVATLVGGNPEVVLDGATGIAIPARSPRHLADAILTLAGAPERGRTFGLAGRERVQRLFTIERMVDDYRGCYRRAWAAKVPASAR